MIRPYNTVLYIVINFRLCKEQQRKQEKLRCQNVSLVSSSAENLGRKIAMIKQKGFEV
jgi:hypothetical protein